MSRLSTRFTRTNIQGGAPAELNIEYESDSKNNVLIIEQRGQQDSGEYPELPDSRFQLSLGSIRDGILKLITSAPNIIGSKKYTIIIADNVTGEALLSDDAFLQIIGSDAVPAIESDSIDFTANPVMFERKETAIRIVYSASEQSGLKLEWLVYRIHEDGPEANPTRVDSYDIGDYYVGDLQFIIPVTEKAGKYRWIWRVIRTDTLEELSKSVRDVVIREEMAVPQSPKLTVEAQKVTEIDTLPTDGIMMGLIAVILLGGLLILGGRR